MSTALLPEVVPEIDANPVSFSREEGGWASVMVLSWTPLGVPAQTLVIRSRSACSPCVSTPHFLTWRRSWVTHIGPPDCTAVEKFKFTFMTGQIQSILSICVNLNKLLTGSVGHSHDKLGRAL